MIRALALSALLCVPASAADAPRPRKKLRLPIPKTEPKGELRQQQGEIRPTREFPQETADVAEKDETPWIVRWMIKPIRRGMWIRLPVMDTDPNRGVTGGVMPIWVIQEESASRIRSIHAPSLTYNGIFGVTPTYRFYHYPASDSAIVARASVGKYEREALLQYEDASLLGSTFDFYGRVQYNIDASRRFYGFGPDSPKSDETTYKEDFIMYRVAVGHPVWAGAPVRVRLSSHLLAQRVRNGPLEGIPGIETRFPQHAPSTRQQSHEFGGVLEYDTRDHAVTTRRGVFAQAGYSGAVRDFASAYDYSRHFVDGRAYFPWTRVPTVTAVQARLEQLAGFAPFWLRPSMGGKYSHRAYGFGRYVDQGVATVHFEQRFKVWEAKMAGVSTEFELAPFAGAGTVFDRVGDAEARHVRPVFGGAVRAVCRPQVVGSVDVGVGREGVAVFMDINYSF